MRLKKLAFAVFAAALFLGMMTRSVQAHTGGVLYLANEPCGEFEVSTWVLPQIVTVAEPVHFDLLILSKSVDGQVEQKFILGADVTVRASTMDGELIQLEDKGSNINSDNELFYEAALMLEEEGQWQIDVLVDDGTNSCATNFVLIVENDSEIDWWMIGGAALVLVGAAIFVLRSRPRGDDG